MIVTVTRDASDLSAIRQTGVRAIAAQSMDAGLHAAANSDAQLLVCDLSTHQLLDRLGAGGLPCPLLVRHDASRSSVAALYGLAMVDADIRSSFRPYDELTERIRSASRQNDANATPAILRRLSPVAGDDLRDFVGTMAILGERPVMQAAVAGSLGLSRSSFRSWLAERRLERPRLPHFPRLNAHFVALHFAWRRERLGWASKRVAAAAGFSDDKAAASYLRYHLGGRMGQLVRGGRFDGLMTVVAQMFTPAEPAGHEAIRRI